MKGVCVSDAGEVCIGGATTHAEVAREAAAHYPALASLAGRIGDPAVRSRGTIGGSLANNDPSACYPAAVLGSGARVLTDRREIAADDFFDGMFATALEEGEIVTEVRFPVPQAAAYEKFVQPASRFALVGVFVARFADGVRVAVTGRLGGWGVPLGGGRGGAGRGFRGGCAGGWRRRGRHDLGPARGRGLPRAPGQGDDGRAVGAAG
jgi:carbon-monoxide dehydrogenase medium subunit